MEHLGKLLIFKMLIHSAYEKLITFSLFQVATQIPPNTYKTVLNAVDGFHAVELDTDSQPLTTFITEWGRYMYLHVPQGFVAAGDIYTRRYDEIIKHILQKVKIVDNTLLYDFDIQSAFYHIWDYLTTCAEKGIVINSNKFKFCKERVEYAGLIITPTIEPSPTTLAAIENFPLSKNLTNACAWFGLINQVSWAYAVSTLMQPFPYLIKPNTPFYWDDQLEDLFQKSKLELINCVKQGIQAFDCDQITLQSDWSKEGIGYLLLQKYCSCSLDKAPVCCKEGWKLAFAGSRFTNSSEQNYSSTEGEALALSWALKHSCLFTLGCKDLFIAVDHKPLLGIFNNQSLDSITNPRVLKLKETTLGWQFKVI